MSVRFGHFQRMQELNISGGQSGFSPQFIHSGAFLGFFINVTAVARTHPLHLSTFLTLFPTTTSSLVHLTSLWRPPRLPAVTLLVKVHLSSSTSEQGKKHELEVSDLAAGLGLMEFSGAVMKHVTNKSDSLRDSVICTLDQPRGCHDAKLTLCQLTVTLILCQLNQGFSL